MFSGSLSNTSATVDAIFDEHIAVQALQSAWTTASARAAVETGSPYFPCMRVASVKFTEFDDDEIVVGAVAVTDYVNTSINGTMAANNSIPTMMPTFAPTPIAQVRVEIQFEAMLLLDGGLGAAAYEYLNAELQTLMVDIKDATAELTQVYNTSIEACCFRWQGGGISAAPVFRVTGSLADDLGSKWGPHVVQNGGEVTSSMQVNYRD
jgi:hypothetical protein